jgi:fucose permease
VSDLLRRAYLIFVLICGFFLAAVFPALFIYVAKTGGAFTSDASFGSALVICGACGYIFGGAISALVASDWNTRLSEEAK